MSNVETVQYWLDEFNRALESGTAAAMARLFESQAYWRDVVALHWGIRTVAGAADITGALSAAASEFALRDMRLDPDATAPRIVTRARRQTLEAFVLFDTSFGRGRGVVRLIGKSFGVSQHGGPVAWTLLTALHELTGMEERVGDNRPTGDVHARDFHGPNWLDKRIQSKAFDDREPAVLVVGAGQAGLSIAARLTQLGVDTLVLEKNARVGDNWRHRYHALTLHNQIYANHLPYMPFPPNWPVYIPKDKLANWLEFYAESMELNVWTGAELIESSYDEQRQQWSATVARADGSERQLRPRHIVMATSVSGIPNIPDIQGLDNYQGEVIHASAYRDGEEHTVKSALVIGMGTSGHDIAQDLASSGANVTMVQRGSTMIINVEPGAQLPYALYHEGPGLEECDLITLGMPFPLQRQSHIGFTAEARKQDKPLLDKLAQRGMRLDYGVDDTGWQFKYLTRGGGYYFNVGASDMIADGRIDLVQFSDIKQFTESGITLANDDSVSTELIVLATGYQGMSAMVGKIFGTDVAESVGPIWGFDGDNLELRNMYCPTPQPGLWFIAGSFAQCRINSKYLALQIRAAEAGLTQ